MRAWLEYFETSSPYASHPYTSTTIVWQESNPASFDDSYTIDL
jgi:hypothetical protein